ncbi:MAG: hypothetical protein IJS15_16150 [Victivallales bacterium]|nr:hypothetical protein [Victivallales bacterium]
MTLSLLWLLMTFTQAHSLPFDHECTDEALAGLAPQVLADFSAAAERYTSETGQRITVTSAKRSLRHCASLMAAMSIEQLEGMYCRNGYPDYIKSMKEAMRSLGRKLTPDEAYEILRNRGEGYISAHLFGAALDVASDGLKDAALLERILADSNFSVLNETELGVNCIHASHKNVKRQIIRE